MNASQQENSIGPREVFIQGNDGTAIPVRIRITFGEVHRFELGGDDHIDQLTGQAFIDCELFSFDTKVHGDDQIQVVFGLLWIAGETLMGRCKRRNLTLYKIRPGDVQEWQDLFR
jgi:hypothetical protein